MATVAATADAWNDVEWNSPKDDPLRQREHQLIAAREGLENQIVTSRDAKENAVSREQINIVNRDLSSVARDRVEQQGPILARSRIFGMWLGTPLTLIIGAYYLEKGVNFIRRIKSAPTTSPKTG